MERFSEYKDSGVQWLGEIPGHWKCMPLKRIITKIESGVSVNGSTSQAASGNELGVLKTGCVSFRIFNPRQNKLVLDEECKRLACSVKGNTIIVSRMNTPELVGSCAFVEKDYPNLFLPDRLWQVYFCDSASVKFLHWMLNSQFVRNRYAQICVGSSSTMQNISQSQFSETNIPLPPLSEQHAIVSYLDDKCGKIDKMLEGKQKQIELLAEMKQCIIADAVTHGLNPDVRMKETNSICLGEVPMHWRVMRYGTLFKLKPVKLHHGEELLSVFLNFGVIRAAESDKRTHAASEDLSKYQLVEPTDFVMNNQQAWRGSVGVSKLTGIISPAYHIFKMPNCFDAEYANYLLRSKAIVGQFEISSRGVGSIQRTLNFNWLNNRTIPVPPLSEQRSIVSYITDKTSKIDTLTSKLQQEIESIKEYKQRLISDVVTGQIKVC